LFICLSEASGLFAVLSSVIGRIISRDISHNFRVILKCTTGQINTMLCANFINIFMAFNKILLGRGCMFYDLSASLLPLATRWQPLLQFVVAAVVDQLCLPPNPVCSCQSACLCLWLLSLPRQLVVSTAAAVACNLLRILTLHCQCNWQALGTAIGDGRCDVVISCNNYLNAAIIFMQTGGQFTGPNQTRPYQNNFTIFTIFIILLLLLRFQLLLLRHWW